MFGRTAALRGESLGMTSRLPQTELQICSPRALGLFDPDSIRSFTPSVLFQQIKEADSKLTCPPSTFQAVNTFPWALTKTVINSPVEYHIQLRDNKPVRPPKYRLAPPRMQFLWEHIKQLLEVGVIEHPLFPAFQPDVSCSPKRTVL